MKTLLRITLFAILCTSCAPKLNETVTSTFMANIINTEATMTPLAFYCKYSLGMSQASKQEDATSQACLRRKLYYEHGEVLLKCHVCRGTFECLGPQNCDIEEKFCMIAETVHEKENRVFKYCSIACPFIGEYHGRASDQEHLYLACCAEDLCNYKRLGSGHRFYASAVVVAMAFIASPGLDF